MRTAIVASLLIIVASSSQSIGLCQEKAAQKKAAGQNQRKVVPIVQVTNQFLATLSEEQKSDAVMEFGSEKRVGWHFIPMETRKGLPLMQMEATQKEAAMKLLRAAVSKLGYDQATTIMQLETVLRKLEGPEGRNERNPEKYYFTVFGKPAAKQQWGLSIEGHHLSLNFVFKGSQIVDSTPQFFASNPAKLQDNYGGKLIKGFEVLEAEEGIAFELVNSLSAEQLEKAMLPGEVPQEIRAAGSVQPPTEAARGIAAADLTEAQQATLKKLMRAYSSKMKPAVDKGRWKLIDDAGFDKIHFAWSGAKQAGRGHYYIVQGPTFLIEFINVQADPAGNPANHIHCVWRDMQGDFDLPIASN